MAISVLRQGPVLIASVPSAPTDAELAQLRDDLAQAVGRVRAQGIIVDVTALDVIDSYATRILSAIAQSTKLRGARTVLVGIQPAVALALVQLGLSQRLRDVAAALDLEEALVLLRAASKGR